MSLDVSTILKIVWDISNPNRILFIPKLSMSSLVAKYTPLASMLVVLILRVGCYGRINSVCNALKCYYTQLQLQKLFFICPTYNLRKSKSYRTLLVSVILRISCYRKSNSVCKV